MKTSSIHFHFCLNETHVGVAGQSIRHHSGEHNQRLGETLDLRQLGQVRALLTELRLNFDKNKIKILSCQSLFKGSSGRFKIKKLSFLIISFASPWILLYLRSKIFIAESRISERDRRISSPLSANRETWTVHNSKKKLAYYSSVARSYLRASNNDNLNTC